MMAEDGGNLSGAPDARGSEDRSSLPRTFIRLNDLSGVGIGGGERGEVVVEPASPAPDGISTAGEDASASGGESLPYPTLAPVVFFYLKQTTRPRSWCLKMHTTSSWLCLGSDAQRPLPLSDAVDQQHRKTRLISGPESILNRHILGKPSALGGLRPFSAV
ncbi:Voltage-dependent T-type calcium channel subunit alpha-1G Cav3.1c [Larimichthys crocea]|uniref:Voltage-dependent T-type calcium channel subunit alpha-1G Cav3.1c n=1 Tax=Larimichthys crocea TaxID=215358 RepID=A0A6G0HZE8_LARCR|nr:Voltage-dependent T-type calcium channel subunit alpha-1G Cav3.1c [Larimichthys crocea]